MEVISEKVCKVCQVAKPRTEYYANPETRDKLQPKCKTCYKIYCDARYARLSKDKEWANKMRIEYNARPKKKRFYPPETRTRLVERFPEKYEAYKKATYLQAVGKGNHLHHWSYNLEDAKDVIELTKEQHKCLHRHLSYDRKTMKYSRKWEGGLLETKRAHFLFALEVFKSENILVEDLILNQMENHREHLKINIQELSFILDVPQPKASEIFKSVCDSQQIKYKLGLKLSLLTLEESGRAILKGIIAKADDIFCYYFRRWEGRMKLLNDPKCIETGRWGSTGNARIKVFLNSADVEKIEQNWKTKRAQFYSQQGLFGVEPVLYAPKKKQGKKETKTMNPN